MTSSTPLDETLYEETLHLARAAQGTIQRGTGDRKAVRAIQERLSNLGIAVEVDGIFGEQTENALKRFQKKYKAKEDGIVGPETLGKLLRAKKPVANAADIGMDLVEQIVGVGEAETEKTGTERGRTRAAQRGSGTLPSTPRKGWGRVESSTAGGSAERPKGEHGGAIDPVTGAERATTTTGPIGSTDPNDLSKQGQRLQEQNEPPKNPEFEKLHPREGGKFVSKGDTGQPVTQVQDRLNRSGLKPKLKVDGDFGPMTEHAVREFQQSQSLKVDGLVGPKTSAALNRKIKHTRSKTGWSGGKKRGK